MANVNPQRDWWKNYYAWYYGQPPVNPWMAYQNPQYATGQFAQVVQPQYVYPYGQYMQPMPYQTVVQQQYASPQIPGQQIVPPTVVQSAAAIRQQQRQQCAAQGGVWRGNQCVARTVRQTRVTAAQLKQQCAAQGGVWRANKCYGAIRDASGAATGQTVAYTTDPATGQLVPTTVVTTPTTTQTTTPSGQAPVVEDLPDMQYGEGGGESYGGEGMSGLGELDLKTIGIVAAIGLGLYLLTKKE